MGFAKSALALLVIAAAAGCGSQIPTLREWADQSVGRPVAELVSLDKKPTSYAARVDWQGKTYTLPNGHWVYVHPDRHHCELHFEVDTAGIVVGYRAVGAGCQNQ